MHPSLTALPSGGLTTLVVVGVFLMLVAIIGWAGVRFNYKVGGRYVLGVYATVLIILMIMEFAAAGMLVTFTGALDAFVSRSVRRRAGRRGVAWGARQEGGGGGAPQGAK